MLVPLVLFLCSPVLYFFWDRNWRGIRSIGTTPANPVHQTSPIDQVSSLSQDLITTTTTTTPFSSGGVTVTTDPVSIFNVSTINVSTAQDFSSTPGTSTQAISNPYALQAFPSTREFPMHHTPSILVLLLHTLRDPFLWLFCGLLLLVTTTLALKWFRGVFLKTICRKLARLMPADADIPPPSEGRVMETLGAYLSFLVNSHASQISVSAEPTSTFCTCRCTNQSSPAAQDSMVLRDLAGQISTALQAQATKNFRALQNQAAQNLMQLETQANQQANTVTALVQLVTNMRNDATRSANVVTSQLNSLSATLQTATEKALSTKWNQFQRDLEKRLNQVMGEVATKKDIQGLSFRTGSQAATRQFESLQREVDTIRQSLRINEKATREAVNQLAMDFYNGLNPLRDTGDNMAMAFSQMQGAVAEIRVETQALSRDLDSLPERTRDQISSILGAFMRARWTVDEFNELEQHFKDGNVDSSEQPLPSDERHREVEQRPRTVRIYAPGDADVNSQKSETIQKAKDEAAKKAKMDTEKTAETDAANELKDGATKLARKNIASKAQNESNHKVKDEAAKKAKADVADLSTDETAKQAREESTSKKISSSTQAQATKQPSRARKQKEEFQKKISTIPSHSTPPSLPAATASATITQQSVITPLAPTESFKQPTQSTQIRNSNDSTSQPGTQQAPSRPIPSTEYSAGQQHAPPEFISVNSSSTSHDIPASPAVETISALTQQGPVLPVVSLPQAAPVVPTITVLPTVSAAPVERPVRTTPPITFEDVPAPLPASATPAQSSSPLRQTSTQERDDQATGPVSSSTETAKRTANEAESPPSEPPTRAPVRIRGNKKPASRRRGGSRSTFPQPTPLEGENIQSSSMARQLPLPTFDPVFLDVTLPTAPPSSQHDTFTLPVRRAPTQSLEPIPEYDPSVEVPQSAYDYTDSTRMTPADVAMEDDALFPDLFNADTHSTQQIVQPPYYNLDAYDPNFQQNQGPYFSHNAYGQQDFWTGTQNLPNLEDIELPDCTLPSTLPTGFEDDDFHAFDELPDAPPTESLLDDINNFIDRHASFLREPIDVDIPDAPIVQDPFHHAGYMDDSASANPQYIVPPENIDPNLPSFPQNESIMPGTTTTEATSVGAPAAIGQIERMTIEEIRRMMYDMEPDEVIRILDQMRPEDVVALVDVNQGPSELDDIDLDQFIDSNTGQGVRSEVAVDSTTIASSGSSAPAHDVPVQSVSGLELVRPPLVTGTLPPFSTVQAVEPRPGTLTDGSVSNLEQRPSMTETAIRPGIPTPEPTESTAGNDAAQEAQNPKEALRQKEVERRKVEREKEKDRKQRLAAERAQRPPIDWDAPVPPVTHSRPSMVISQPHVQPVSPDPDSSLSGVTQQTSNFTSSAPGSSKNRMARQDDSQPDDPRPATAQPPQDTEDSARRTAAWSSDTGGLKKQKRKGSFTQPSNAQALPSDAPSQNQRSIDWQQGPPVNDTSQSVQQSSRKREWTANEDGGKKQKTTGEYTGEMPMTQEEIDFFNDDSGLESPSAGIAMWARIDAEQAAEAAAKAERNAARKAAKAKEKADLEKEERACAQVEGNWDDLLRDEEEPVPVPAAGDEDMNDDQNFEHDENQQDEKEAKEDDYTADLYDPGDLYSLP